MNRLAQNSSGLSRLVWTSGIAVGASLPHWSRLPVWIPVLLCMAVAWRFAARLLGWPLPRAWLTGAITVGAFIGVVLEFGTVNGLQPGTALLVVMVALKLLETRTQRDQIILLAITYFLVFASVLAGGGLVKATYLIVFVWITTVGMLQVGRMGPMLPYGPTGKQAGKLLLQAIPLMLVLFLLFPRLPGPLWSLPGDNSSAATGLSGSMSPGDITSLGMSDAIAFRVEFDGQVPAASELYWRGPVLTRFDGRRWTQRVGMARPVENTLELIGGISRYRVSLDAGANNWAFALDMPASWSVEERAAAIRMRSEYQLALFAPDGNSQRVPYSVTSYSDYRAREPLDADGIDYYRRLPEGRNPRARALVNSWLAESSDQDFLITQALDLFRADDFYYTLTPPPLGEHSVDEFLFETREGFCEHYASAFAVLMRMAGIPARVVTGYQGGERNGFGDYYIIRQSDAHAWTEVWSPAAGWRRVDPISAVAPERIALGSSRIDFREGATVVQRLGRITLMRQLALSWDAVNRVWNNWVIGYSPGLQLDLFEKLGFERPTRRQLLLLSAVAMALGMLALTLYFGFRLRRRRPQDPACVSFRHFTRKLRQAAIAPMQPGETPTAFASRAAAALPAAAGPIRSITDAYLAARYEPDADCIALRQLQRLVGEFRPGYVPASP